MIQPRPSLRGPEAGCAARCAAGSRRSCFTLPKSLSLLLAFADEDTAAAVERLYTGQVGATFDWLQTQTAYGMRGKHGDGHTASTVPGSGFLGWWMVHRAARPVGERVVGDPHWHVHVTVANMTRGTDGAWSTVAAGGRDLKATPNQGSQQRTLCHNANGQRRNIAAAPDT